LGAQPDYSSLLIKPSDVGPNATADDPPTANAHGAPGVMSALENGDYSVGDIIYVLSDPSADAQMIPTMKDELSKKSTVRRSRSTSVPTGWCYAANATFHVDGDMDSNNAPLPMPDY
jgi:hypothetical protein